MQKFFFPNLPDSMAVAIPIPSVVEKIKEIFDCEQYDFYLVGGFVRDFLLNKGRVSGDMDFTTNAAPEKIGVMFQGHEFKVIPTGINHGTVTVVTNSGNFEITTYRHDGNYLDGRRPESVTFSESLEEELARRDFTINALVYDLDQHRIIDYHGGLIDLEHQVIRCIGDPSERFYEDALRMIRACRLSAQLGFTVESKTLAAIEKQSNRVMKLSSERIQEELIKMIDYSCDSGKEEKRNQPERGIELLQKTGILAFIFPELEATRGVQQNHFHSYDVYDHSVLAVKNLRKFKLSYPYQVGLAILFHDVAKPITKKTHHETGEATFYNHEVEGAELTKKILKRLKFSNRDIDFITHLIRHHMFHYSSEWKDSAVRRFVRKVGFEYLDHLFHVVRADRSAKLLESFESWKFQNDQDIEEIERRIEELKKIEFCLSVKDLKINGNDLMKHFRLSGGPLLGEILNSLLEEVIENPNLNHREKLLGLATSYLDHRSLAFKKEYRKDRL